MSGFIREINQCPDITRDVAPFIATYMLLRNAPLQNGVRPPVSTHYFGDVSSCEGSKGGPGASARGESGVPGVG